MTKDEALKMAIEALEMHVPYYIKDKGCDALIACKEALEQSALDWMIKEKKLEHLKEQPEPRMFLDLSNSNGNHPIEQPAQEPVGKWESKCKCDFRTKLVGDGCKYCNTEEYICKLHSDYDYLLEENEQLLTHPAPSWRGLSDEEIFNISEIDEIRWEDGTIRMNPFARAIEAKLKEKNT